VAGSGANVAPALVDFITWFVVAYAMFPFDGSNSASNVELGQSVFHVTPPSSVRIRPALVAARRIFGLLGWMTSLLIVRFCPTDRPGPSGLQPAPPFVGDPPRIE